MDTAAYHTRYPQRQGGVLTDMKACLYIGAEGSEWVLKLLPNLSPGELPVAGKSWCRHAIDICSQLGVNDVYIADNFMHDELAHQLGKGEFWTLNLDVRRCGECAVPSQLLEEIPELADNSEDLLIFWGTVLPDIREVGELLENLRPVETGLEHLPPGIWLRRGGQLYGCACPLLRIDSLKHYFDLNFRMLDAPGIYTLPGYSGQPGVNLGRNVIIMPHCSIQPPVIIQDDCSLGRSLSLKGGVIIGHETLIDDSSEIEHSIILNGTYIGKNLFIRDKIVAGSRVIDIANGEFVDIDDDFLLKRSDPIRFDRFTFAQILLGWATAIVLTPLYLLALPFRRWLTRLPFFEFMMRIYPNCWLAAIGRKHLIRMGADDNGYAFRYSDQWVKYQSDHQKELADVYFYSHRNVRDMIEVVTNSLLKRFFILSYPKPEDSSGDERPE